MEVMANEFRFQKFPKLELHAHLNGSLSTETLQKLEKLAGEENETAAGWPMCSQDLSSCFQLFAVAHNLTNSPRAVKLATVSTIQEFAEDGVIYLELRSTPRREREMSKEQYLEALLQGVTEARRIVPDIIVKIIVSVNRGETVDNATENIKLAIYFNSIHPDIFVGVDLSGDPMKGQFEEFESMLRMARNSNLAITVHCGEISNDKEIEEILNFKADRLGHGTFIIGKNFETLCAQGTPLELCISSNIKCGTVKSVQEHHVKKYKEVNHPFILCTDDKGVFGTTLSEEYKLASSAFNLSRKECFDLNYRAVNFVFADNATKAQLRDTLTKWRDLSELL